MKYFCVAGSLNMDMVTRVGRFPHPGETLTGYSFNVFPGGKGGNQAVGLARLGAKVEMIAALGSDHLGQNYRDILEKSGVSTAHIHTFPEASTGTATIEVNNEGENHIIVVPGANGMITPEMIRHYRDIISGSAALLLQLEIPLESVMAAADIASNAGIPVLLDPAPARYLPEELYREISIITPNETEANILTGINTEDDAGLEKAGRILLERGVGSVVIKAGARGAYLIKKDMFKHYPGFTVNAIDTVAAGDAFNAALAFSIGQGIEIEHAIRLANAAGALSTTKEGAQSVMPTMKEALDLMNVL